MRAHIINFMLPELKDVIRSRKMLGLTQKKLAKLAGVSQSLIAKIETSRVDPSYGNMKKIINALDKMEGEIKIMIRAKDIYNKSVISINKFDSIFKASQVMRKNGYSQLPVYDGDQIVGSISESIILNEVSEKKDYTCISKMNVEYLMGSPFPQIDENTPVESIKSLLKYYQAILIIKRNNIVGIITKADLLSLI